MKNPPKLTERSMQRILLALNKINQEANGRKWIAVIYYDEGIPRIHKSIPVETRVKA